MTNQVFSFKRYWWLVKRQWYENAAVYKWGIAGIVLITLVVGWLGWMSGDLSPNEYPRFQLKEKGFINLDIPILLLYVYGALFFNNLSSKCKGMSYFSLPVLPLERVMATFTFVIVLMPVFMTIVFTVSDFAYIQIFNHIHGVSMPMFIKPTNPFGIPETSWITTFWYISIISMFTLGSLLFGKKGFIITIMATFLFVIPTFIPIETKVTENNSIKVKTETSETVEMIKTIKSVESSVTGRAMRTSCSVSSSDTGVSFNTLTETIETVEISETVETSQTSRQFILGIIFKFFYSVITPFCWAMMYFVMKRKEA